MSSNFSKNDLQYDYQPASLGPWVRKLASRLLYSEHKLYKHCTCLDHQEDIVMDCYDTWGASVSLFYLIVLLFAIEPLLSCDAPWPSRKPVRSGETCEAAASHWMN